MITFEVDPPDAESWRRRFDGLESRRLPFLVAETAATVVGYAYAGPWKERTAYRRTVEDAIYLARESRGRGVGAVLLRALLDSCREVGVREVIAVIADTGDPASVRLHRRCGLRAAGRLERVGFKHGLRLDTVLMQCSLTAPGDPAEELDGPT